MKTKSIYQNDCELIFEEHGNQDYYHGKGAVLAAESKALWVSDYVPIGSTLLDIGSNYGYFLNAVKHRYDAVGCELSTKAVNWSVRHLGIRNFSCSVFDLPSQMPGTYQAITCWDVLEHLHDPLRALEIVYNSLETGGYAFFTTPDSGSIMAKIMRRYWYYLDPIQHLHIFSKKNLIKHLHHQGFNIVSSHYIGRTYEMNYIINRLNYLLSSTPLKHLFDQLIKRDRQFKNINIPIKLFDVLGVVVRK